MEKADFQRGDSDSGKIPIADEKTRHLPLEAIPDPDDGLSAEERAKIVYTRSSPLAARMG
jgi:hypothetical protein